MKERFFKVGMWRPSLKKAVSIGIVLLCALLILSCHLETVKTTRTANNTLNAMQQQCVLFDKLMTTDRTKSLFRLIDTMRTLRTELANDAQTIDGTYLQRFADNALLTGVAVMDGAMHTEAYVSTERFRTSRWTDFPKAVRLTAPLEHPAYILAERTTFNGEFVDVCALARLDAPGVIIGFYQQPSGLVSDTENDLEDMLSGVYPEHNGSYAIVESGAVRAASDAAIKGKSVSESMVISRLSQTEKDGKLHLFYADGAFLWGSRSTYGAYSLYVYYTSLAVFRSSIVTAAVFFAVYLLLCLISLGVRSRAVYESEERMRSVNLDFKRMVRMLEALETIYFSLFYVDVKNNTYETVYLAPWLSAVVPEQGEYSFVKSIFLHALAAPDFRDELEYRMSESYIRETLGKRSVSDNRRSFYVDYQAIRHGRRCWCRMTATVVDHDSKGNPFHVLALIQDIDKDKTREQEYQTRIMEEAREAKVANAAKTDFLRRISHDIRTPINGINGYIRMAVESTGDPELQRRCLENALDSVDTLMTLVNSVLDMSKLEGGEIVLEEKPFDLEHVLHEIDTVLRPQAEAKNIRYEVAEHEPLAVTHLIGSPRHLMQILMNLANNAVKYGRSGGYIRIETTLLSRTDEEATYEFVCADNGIGMSREFQQRMFEPFVQEANDARTTYNGIGLGLAIVKKLVDALGGTITCQSEKDAGTTFCIRLTFRIDASPAGEEAALPQSESADLTGVSILLAEDNALNMEIVEMFLQGSGASITEVWNGAEAVERFASSPAAQFDLILMDIMMPVMDGLEAARKIRALDRPDAKTVPIIAMSANAFSDDIRRSLDAGMDDHISKPVDKKTLFSIVGKLVRRGL